MNYQFTSRAVWRVVLSTRWWFLVDHCVLRNWDRILVRAVKGWISRAGMVSICPLLGQRGVKLQQTNQTSWHLTLCGIERSNQGHLVFIGLCIILNILLDSGREASCYVLGWKCNYLNSWFFINGWCLSYVFLGKRFDWLFDPPEMYYMPGYCHRTVYHTVTCQ